jgi:glycosyltransferase involved in cell wall biosynthesis
MRVAFVTNICPHYRVRTYEILAGYQSVTYYFFSAGKEKYWQALHGTRTGNFEHEYLAGVNIAGTRFTPSLIPKLFRIPCDVFIKCINGRFALPVTYMIARLRGKPFVLWTGIWMSLNTRFHRLIFPVTRYIYTHSDAVVVYGEHVRRYLISQGVQAEKIFVAAHAIDNASYNRTIANSELSDLRKKLDLTPEQHVVLYLGRLEKNKGLRYLLQAFQQLDRSDVVLVLAGVGEEKEALREQASEAKLTETIRFAGYVPSAETPPYYALADVLVLPSITTDKEKEPWGLVVNEAMNQGCPVIASDAVGAAAGGLVHDGANGLIVPERDSAALCEALRRILDDPNLRAAMSNSARATIAAWDNEQMVAGFRRAINFAVGQV